MSRTGYYRGTSGNTYYAKPLPIVASPWATDAVTGTETGTTGSFSFASLGDTTAYEIFQQAGGSPADSDTALASIDALQDVLDAAGVRTAVGLASANLDTQLAALPTNAPLDAAGIRTAVGLATGNLDTQLSAIPTTAPLDAAGTRAALGMSAANLDTQLSTIDTELGQALDRAGYTMAVLTGAISDADTSTNTFTVTIDGVTYTVTNNGVGTDGDRTAPTLAKA